MEQAITLSKAQASALEKGVKAVNDAALAVQVAQARHQDAVNGLRILVAFAADEIEYDFEKTEIRDGVLILRKDKPEEVTTDG